MMSSLAWKVIAAIVIVIGSTSGATTPVCDVGWVTAGGYCYFFNNVDNVTWDQANIECSTRYAELLSYHAHSMTGDVQANLHKYPSDGFWTALNDRSPGTTTGTGTWLWGDDEYPDPSTIVWNTEPDDNKQEACAAINIQGQFSNEMCGRRYAYICEYAKTSDGGCPAFWLIGTNKCMFVSNFSDPSQLLTWNEANTKCSSWQPPQAVGSPVRLMTVDDGTDTSDIQATVPSWTQTTVLYWTGLIDKAANNTWSWISGATYDTTLIGWVKEPNNLAGRENCGLLLPDASFSDRDCSQSNNYICSKPSQTASTSVNLGCGTWTRAGHKCLFFHSQPKSWPQAKGLCSSQGGSLFSIDSKDDLLYIDMQSRTAKMSWGDYWIGLNDRDQEGTWVWTSGTAADPKLLQWNSDPDDSNGDQDCAMMDQAGVFGDVSCTTDHMGYVCEKLADVNTSCPTGWILSPTWGRGQECYLIGQNWVTWQEAFKICTDKSRDGTGYLFGVTTSDEKNWLLQQLRQVQTPPLQWWSGYTDSAVEGLWLHYSPVEQDPLAVQPLLVWNTEPNNWGGDEDCVSMIYGGRLNDANCSAPHNFICQKTAAGSSLRGLSPFALTLGVILAVLFSHLSSDGR